MISEKIVSVRYIGTSETMDIEVDNSDHIFYANGIATSNSHAVCYAVNAFYSAYIKAHDPLKFFTESLNEAHNKPEKMKEIKELIMDARLSNIEVYPPRLEHLFEDFVEDRKKNIIYYGYSHAKNVGDGVKEKIKEVILAAKEKVGKDLGEFSWPECLFYIASKLTSKPLISLITVGAFSGKNNLVSRNEMLYQVRAISKLTDREVAWITTYWEENRGLDLIAAVRAMLNNYKLTASRHKVVMSIYDTLVNPPYSLEDQNSWIADREEELLGCALSCSKVDTEFANPQINVSCRELASGDARPSKGGCIAIKINRIYEHTTKDGRIMAFISGEDGSGETSGVVVFSDEFNNFKKLLFTGNTVLLYGEIKRRAKDLSFIVNTVNQI